MKRRNEAVHKTEKMRTRFVMGCNICERTLICNIEANFFVFITVLNCRRILIFVDCKSCPHLVAANENKIGSIVFELLLKT